MAAARLAKVDVSEKRESLADLCRQYRVDRLYPFGSAATGQFNSTSSDLDFLVALQDQPATEYAENYFGLAHALQQLFDRPVDLVTESSIRNRYFREAIHWRRQLPDDGRDEKARA